MLIMSLFYQKHHFYTCSKRIDAEKVEFLKPAGVVTTVGVPRGLLFLKDPCFPIDHPVGPAAKLPSGPLLADLSTDHLRQFYILLQQRLDDVLLVPRHVAFDLVFLADLGLDPLWLDASPAVFDCEVRWD